MLVRWLCPLAVFLLSSGVPAALPGKEIPPSAAGVQFFETKVRPVLVRHCYSCHSVEARKKRGGLLVDSRAGLLAGGCPW